MPVRPKSPVLRDPRTAAEAGTDTAQGEPEHAAAQGEPEHAVVTIEREITLLLRRTLEEVWARGYGAGTAVNRYSYPLLVLLEQVGPLRLGHLADRLGVSKPTVSRQVTRLRAEELVLVADDPHDSRSGLVTLTAAGRRQVEEVRSRRMAPLRRVLAAWGGPERDRFAQLLSEFNQGLDVNGPERP